MQSLFAFLKDKQKLKQALPLLLIVVALPLVVIIAQKQQELRQRAATSLNCNNGLTCSVCTGAGSNNCSYGNGRQTCTYTTSLDGQSCNPVTFTNVICYQNNCSSGFTCSSSQTCVSNGGATPTPTKAPTATPTAIVAACGSLQARIDSAPAGSLIDLTGCSYTAGATINKTITIKGGTINVPSNAKGLTVTANDVVIDGVKITGVNKTTFNGNEYGVYADGPKNLTIRNSNIGVFGYSSIYGYGNTNLTIANNTLYDDVYAGIMIISGTGGTVSNNTILRIGVVGYEARQMNSYGIALTDTGGVPTTGFTVSANTIDNVPQWHGIDSHGGRNLTIQDNIIHRTNRAIFLTSSANGGVQNVKVNRNTMDTPTRRVDVLNTYPYNQVGITVVSGAVNVTGDGNKFDGWPSGNHIDTQGGSNNFTNNTITNPK